MKTVLQRYISIPLSVCSSWQGLSVSTSSISFTSSNNLGAPTTLFCLDSWLTPWSRHVTMHHSTDQLHHPRFNWLFVCLKRKKGHAKAEGPLQKQQKDLWIPLLFLNRTWEVESRMGEFSVSWIWWPNPSSFHLLHHILLWRVKQANFWSSG